MIVWIGISVAAVLIINLLLSVEGLGTKTDLTARPVGKEQQATRGCLT